MSLDFQSTLQEINALKKEPERGTEKHNRWIRHENTIGYLLNSSHGIAPIYASVDSFYLYTVFAPSELLAGDYVDDLLEWNFMASHGWGYSTYSEGGKQHATVSPPLDYTGSKILDGKQPIVYYRQFYGHPRGSESYLELDQPIAHILDIHWVERMNSYCKLDHLGDIQPVVSFFYDEIGKLALADLSELELFELLTGSVILRVFEFMHYRGTPWYGDPCSEEIVSVKEEHTELHAKLVVQADIQSYLRGFQVIRQSRSNEELMSILNWRPESDKEYASYIALDWKNRRVIEWSCSPDALASYFEDSNLPFQTTPAFFRSEVLLRYKQDPDKYTVEQRQIVCRGTWSLRYDINKQNQVHAYLGDLGNLPYEEQIHWKSFNEPPKSGISSRAYKTDFLAEWDLSYDPLASLKAILNDFPLANQFGQQQPIWQKPKRTDPFHKLVGVATDSSKEWEDQVLELAKLLVDNVSKKNIRKVAKTLGCDSPSHGSLKLLKSSLEAKQVDKEIIEETLAPLEEIWTLRSRGIAHHGEKAPNIDLRRHFYNLLKSADIAMRNLAELVEHGYFDIERKIKT